MKKFLETNKNRDTTYQNLWDTLKAILRGKFIALSAHIKRTENHQINNLMTHLKALEKQERSNPKTSEDRKLLKSEQKSMK